MENTRISLESKDIDSIMEIVKKSMDEINFKIRIHDDQDSIVRVESFIPDLDFISIFNKKGLLRDENDLYSR